MTIEAKIIADSINEDGDRLTTMQLRYQRFIHSEFMTHRVMSRNASSSRAIPVERMIREILDDTAMPIHWGKNQPGMQAREENDALVLCGANITQAERYGPYVHPKDAWLYARDRAIEMAQNFHGAGYHKQIVNRLLEPFMHISVVVTATEWSNFFDLRCHPDAQPEIQALACAMRDARDASAPEMLRTGQWHLPYVRNEDHLFPVEIARKISAARCARVSYLTHDGETPSFEEDMALFERLAGSRPIHASPLEHQATPGGNFARWGNFTGWHQHRKIFELDLALLDWNA